MYIIGVVLPLHFLQVEFLLQEASELQEEMVSRVDTMIFIRVKLKERKN